MKPGDKVVCVDDSPCAVCGDSMGLVLSSGFRVLEVCIHENGLPVIRMAGFKPSCYANHGNNSQNWANIRRFRKLSEIKSELAALMGKPETVTSK